MIRALSELLRRAIGEILLPCRRRPWMKFAGFVQTPDFASSRSVDELVYGQRD